MIPIVIDTSDLSSEFSLTKTDVENLVDLAVKGVTAEFARLWIEQAEANLHSSRDRYIRNLSVIDEGKMAGAVILRYYGDSLIEMIEDGSGAFDMKKYYEKSSKKKDKKDGGWYLTVPFRWATPDALGESEVFSGKMPSEVYSIVSAQTPDREIEGGKISSGIKLDELPSALQEPNIRWGVASIPESKVFKEYQNKTSKYVGIAKKQDSTTGQNSYISFRRVSDESDDQSWIHTGITAYNLADRALGELDIPKQVDYSIDNFLAQMM